MMESRIIGQLSLLDEARAQLAELGVDDSTAFGVSQFETLAIVKAQFAKEKLGQNARVLVALSA